MFKSIKEFFVGKPKVEEVPYKVEATPQLDPVPALEPIITSEPIAVVEEIKPETVFISASDNMNISISTQSDTIILTPPVVDNTVWPFPKAVPVEEPVKTRTPVKQKEAVSTKKPAPAITANKNKPRKKK